MTIALLWKQRLEPERLSCMLPSDTVNLWKGHVKFSVCDAWIRIFYIRVGYLIGCCVNFSGNVKIVSRCTISPTNPQNRNWLLCIFHPKNRRISVCQSPVKTKLHCSGSVVNNFYVICRSFTVDILTHFCCVQCSAACTDAAKRRVVRNSRLGWYADNRI